MAKDLNGQQLNDTLSDVLADHADNLVAGRDTTDTVLAAHGEDFPALDGLLTMARRLRETLVPVEPHPEFVDELRTKLTKIDEKEAQAVSWWVRTRQKIAARSSLVGGVVGGLAIAAVVVRITGSIVVLVAYILQRRKRTAAV